MKRFFVVLGVAAGLMLMCGQSWATGYHGTHDQWDGGQWTGNVNLTLGGKYLDSDDWEPVENQGELGVSLDFRERSWPVNLLVQFLGSSADDTLHGVDVKGETSEFRLGVRKIFEPDGTIRPFVSAGVASVWAKTRGEAGGYSVSDDDSALGVFIDGGLYFTINRVFNLGVEVGYSAAQVDFMGEDGEAGGTHAGLLVGYHW
jgi:hypothetical protein